MPENKIFYGLSGVHIAPITAMTDGVPTYGAVFAFPGAVSWGQNAEGENSTFRADNIDYYTQAGNDGYTGDLVVARVIDEFAQKIYGQLTGANGELIEVVQGEAVAFGMVLQIEGDQNATRHVYPYCTAGRPSADHSTTEEGSVTPGTETIPVTCKPIAVNGIEKKVVKYRIPQGASNYETILTNFSLPTLPTLPSA